MRRGLPILSRIPFLPRRFAREKLLILLLLLLAAFFRFYHLYQVPPGFLDDQAANAFDIIRMEQGQFSIFFAANTGREPLFIYLQIVGVLLFGPTSFALRLTSAVIGLLTIPLVYGFAKTLFRSVSLAALATIFTAISFWHIFYSRDGLRVILIVPLTLGAFWFLWHALNRLRRRDFVLAGVFTTLSIYTYLSGRLLPIGLIILTAYEVVSNRRQARAYVVGLAWALAVGAILVLPLGFYFLFHPDQFISHTAQLSILSPDVNGGSVSGALVRNTQRVLGSLLFTGDSNLTRNWPGRPVFDPLIGSLFVVGAVVWLVALFHPRSTPLDRRRSLFLATWLGLSLGASIFSDDAPSFLRMLPGLPAVMILPAWGAAAIWQRVHKPRMRQMLAIVLALMITGSLLLTFHDYFVAFGESPAVYYAFDADKVQVADWINQNARSAEIFLAPLWYRQGTISFLTRDAPLKSFDSRDTVVLPSSSQGADAVFAFPPEQAQRIETMAERLGGIGSRQDLIGPDGSKLLLKYLVPAAHLPESQDPETWLEQVGRYLKPQYVDHADWDNQIELLGYSIEASDPPKRNLMVTLFLHSLKPMAEDYTFSLRASDSQGRVWGQEDKFPGDNSYSTSHWGAGDVVIERFYPGLSACAAAGDYQITAELYDPKMMRVLPLTDRGGTRLVLTTTHAETAPSNRLQDLVPDQTAELDIGPGMQLIGFTLTPKQVRSGDSFALELYWRGSGEAIQPHQLTVQLRDAALHDFPLVGKTISIPRAGRGVCTLFDLTVPQGIAPGDASIIANQTRLGSLNIAR